MSRFCVLHGRADGRIVGALFFLLGAGAARCRHHDASYIVTSFQPAFFLSGSSTLRGADHSPASPRVTASLSRLVWNWTRAELGFVADLAWASMTSTATRGSMTRFSFLFFVWGVGRHCDDDDGEAFCHDVACVP
ncbi:hypothetical protein B0H19DRAFT_83396 [Mycena capillaripes]|nr:hypothetical protein B0H19DRAFT_83396 [Mycena capillaripes]